MPTGSLFNTSGLRGWVRDSGAKRVEKKNEVLGEVTGVLKVEGPLGRVSTALHPSKWAGYTMGVLETTGLGG